MKTKESRTSNANRLMAGVILCAGGGTRMGRTRSHKVCEPIAGRPAIVRLIDTLRADKVEPIVVVVGHRAGDVVETIGASHPGVLFVYQRDQLGTGHAARVGIEALGRLGYEGNVLITMGDKWFAPELVSEAEKRFCATNADLLIVTTPKHPDSSAGRLVNLPDRGIVGIVELRDIQRTRVLADWLALASKKARLTKAGLREVGLKRISPAKKLWRALGPLARFARGSGTVRSSELAQAIRETGLAIRVGDKALGPDQVERRSRTVNESVYIGRLGVVQAALRSLGRDNAQDEYYLTDVVEILGGESQGAVTGRVTELRVEPEQVLAFNTKAELHRVAHHVREREYDRFERAAGRRLRPYLRLAEQWYDLLSPESKPGRLLVERVYGAGGLLIKERLRALRGAVRLSAKAYGADQKFFLVRAPGRINLMGRHIDHQGGFVHSMALDSEIVMSVRPRDDDVIRLVNSDAVAFPARELVINDWLPALRTSDWLDFVDGQAVREHLLSTAGDWSNYVLAAVLYQQFHHRDRRLRGMDVAVSGNVPMAAGLSSSSSLVVAAMEAVNAVNAIHATGPDVVSACGQAEWFVGSRGGAADHAAIRLGRAGHVARMGFHPFRMSRDVPIPPGAAILIAYSGQHAVKSAGARDRFNERVACYRLGMLLLGRRYPRLAGRLEYVRDLLPSRLKSPAGEVRDMIASLPAGISRRGIRNRLGASFADRLGHIFSSHADPGRYTVRDVVTFGVGECERSRIAARLLERDDLEAFGELMLLSHDGDRVSGSPAWPDLSSRADADRRPLDRLIGEYGCSTERIDRLVDLARGVPGVYGAQLAGAGLGGCVMVLARRSAAGKVAAVLAAEYYRPLGMKPAVWQVKAVNGGGIIRP